MIVLYPDKTGQMATVFIKRVDYEGVHSGQIAFPGGKYEPGDRDLLQTAIRETREEIGLEIGEHEVVGKLTDLYVPPSNFMISPYVAVLKNLPELYPDKTEVAEIFSAPVLQFLGDGSMTFQKYRFANGQEIDVPGFNFGRHFIWGATAMIFREMIQIIKEVNQQE